VQVTTDVWHGVSSAGITAEWLAEAAEAADASPTFAQPSIATHKGAAYVQASLEVLQDSRQLDDTLAEMFADARSRKEADAFVLGSGTGQP
jgi:HK97 family phage major capsid protein